MTVPAGSCYSVSSLLTLRKNVAFGGGGFAKNGRGEACGYGLAASAQIPWGG